MEISREATKFVTVDIAAVLDKIEKRTWRRSSHSLWDELLCMYIYIEDFERRTNTRSQELYIYMNAIMTVSHAACRERERER